MIDNGLARLARALNTEQEPERCKWPLAPCHYPAVLGGLCGKHRGMELRDREEALRARANATTKPKGTA
jgi:hypothetical protein